MEKPCVGDDAYLSKTVPCRHLLDAISFVRDGAYTCRPCCAAPASSPRPRRAVPRTRWLLLSPREMKVFAYLVNGLRAKDIADLLEISPKKVHTYRASL